MRMGIDLGGTKIEGAVLDDEGTIIWRQRVATPAHDYDRVIAEIRKLVVSMVDEHAIAADVPLGIGTPGTYSPAMQRMKNCNSVYLNGRNFPADLQQCLQREVRIANDANCFALSEAVSGAAAGADTVFGVILGTGAGGGLVVNRKLVNGANGISGEWGHNPLVLQQQTAEYEIIEPRSDRCCYCGRINCVETYLSGTGFEKSHELETGEKLPAREIYTRALQQGDAAAERVFQVFLQQLARNLAVIINIVDPDVIVLGGGLSNMELIYERLPLLWKPHVFSDDIATRLVRAQHGDSSGVIGAAWL